MFLILCGKSNSKRIPPENKFVKTRKLFYKNNKTNRIEENAFSNQYTNADLINNQLLNFEDAILLFQFFGTNWWNTDQNLISNLLKKASFETCNKLCNICGGQEDYYGERLIAQFGLEKAASLYQSNNMLVRIAQSSYLMRDLHSATQSLNKIVDDGSPEVANYCYQKQLFSKSIYANCEDYDSAIKCAETILNKYSNVQPFVKPSALISLATLYLYQGKPDKARKQLEEYLKLDEDKYKVNRKSYVLKMLNNIEKGTWAKDWHKPITEKDWIRDYRERGVTWQKILNEMVNESSRPETPTLKTILENKIKRTSNYYYNIHE